MNETAGGKSVTASEENQSMSGVELFPREKRKLHLCAAMLLLPFAFICPAFADAPAGSLAQLEAVSGQIAALQAQQQVARNELSGLEVQRSEIQRQIDALVAKANASTALRTNELALAAEAKIRGISIAEMVYQAIADDSENHQQLAVLRGQLQNIEGRVATLGQEIAARDNQIGQLQATLTYLQNPVRGDLESERTHLRNLGNQEAVKDDQGQLQWDIENTRRRIKELEQQFQQSGPGGTSGTAGGSAGQSVQPQAPSYTSPTAGFGTPGPAGQSPPTAGGYPGYPPSYGSPPPQIPWEGLAPPPSGGGGQPKNPCGAG